MPKKTKTIDMQMINAAVEEGINQIMEQHPVFKNKAEYISTHLDKKKLNKKISEIYHLIEQQRNLSEETKAQYLQQGIANYVASGELFDDAGKQIILKNGLEGRVSGGFFRTLFGRQKLDGDKYLNETLGAFQNLYELFKTGDYAQRMPELAQAVTTVNDMGFLDPAVEVLKHYGLIDDRKYDLLKQNIRKKTEQAVTTAVTGIEKYSMYEKAAAIIFGILGLIVIFSSQISLIGGVIGISNNLTTGIVGGLLIFLSLILFLKIFKKK